MKINNVTRISSESYSLNLLYAHYHVALHVSCKFYLTLSMIFLRRWQILPSSLINNQISFQLQHIINQQAGMMMQVTIIITVTSAPVSSLPLFCAPVFPFRCCMEVKKGVAYRPAMWSWTATVTGSCRHTRLLRRTVTGRLEVWGHWVAPSPFPEENLPPPASAGSIQRRPAAGVCLLMCRESGNFEPNVFISRKLLFFFWGRNLLLVFFCRFGHDDNVFYFSVALCSNWISFLLD